MGRGEVQVDVYEIRQVREDGVVLYLVSIGMFVRQGGEGPDLYRMVAGNLLKDQ